MKLTCLLKYSVLAASVAALGGALVAGSAVAADRGFFIHKLNKKFDRSGGREVIEFATRADIRPLPSPLKQRLIRLAKRPHTYLPMTLFGEAEPEIGRAHV